MLLAYLNETILWWHWISLGLFLLILEMNTGTFVILGLGVSAVIVGIVDFFTPMTFQNQILTWITLSLISLWAWKKWMRTPHVSNTGQSDHSLDTLGTVNQEIHPYKRGKVTFDTPVLGNTTWHATATEQIEKGARVKINEINGQLIAVTKI